MAILDRIASVFSSRPLGDDAVVGRALDSPFSGGATLYQGQGGVRKGTPEVLALYRESPRLRAATHRIASSVAKVEWRLYAKRAPDGAKGGVYELDQSIQELQFEERHAYIKKAITDGAVDEISAHPALRIINRPNRMMTGYSARMITQVHLDIAGDAFWIVDTNDAGMPVRLWPIPPSWVTQVPSKTDPAYHVTFGGFSGVVPVENMIWLKDIDPSEPYGRGSGLGMAIADELDIDEHASKTVSAWFQNNAMPSMLVSLKGANQATTERARLRWNNTLKGFRRAYQTYFTGADISVQRLDTSFKDMALVDIRKEVRDIVNQTYGLPPEKVGIIENSNRATSEASDLIFTKDVLLPRLEFLRQELQAKLIPRFDPRLIIDFVDPVPEDKEAKDKVASQLPAVLSIDEHRARGGLEPLADGSGQGFLVGQVWVRSLSDLQAKTNVPLYGYHLAAGLLTNNEARSILGLQPTAAPWGDERTVGTYNPTMAAAMKEEPAQPIEPGLPPPESDELAGFSPSEEDIAAERARRTHTKKKWVTVKQTRSIINAIRLDALIDEVEPFAKALIEEWIEATLSDVASVSGNASASERVVSKKTIDSFVSTYKGRIAHINETTKDRVRAALEAWDGESKSSLLSSVRAVFNSAKTSRAQVISTCEALHLGQWASNAAMKETGDIIEMKEWLAVMDGRTREAHRALDGQTVPVDVPFVVPEGEWKGYQADAPGQFGEPALDYNCRCYAAPFFVTEGEDKEAADARRLLRWQERDAAMRRWEARLADAFVDGFDAQESAVMARLDELISDD